MLGGSQENGGYVPSDGLVIKESISLVSLVDGHSLLHRGVKGSPALVPLDDIVREVEADTEHGNVVVVFHIVVSDVVVSDIKAVIVEALHVQVRAVSVVHDDVVCDVGVEGGSFSIGPDSDASSVMG